MLTLIAVACFLSDPPKTTAYDGLLVEQREALTEEWRKALAEAEVAVPKLKQEAVRARYNIRRVPRAKKAAALEAANKADEAAKNAEKRLTALRKNDPPFVPEFQGIPGTPGYSMEQKRVGRPYHDLRIVQKFDGRDTLIESIHDFTDAQGTRIRVRPLFIVRDQAIASSAVDGSPLELDGIWQVTSTKSYATASGSQKTVPVLERLEWPDHQGTAARKD